MTSSLLSDDEQRLHKARATLADFASHTEYELQLACIAVAHLSDDPVEVRNARKMFYQLDGDLHP